MSKWKLVENRKRRRSIAMATGLLLLCLPMAGCASYGATSLKAETHASIDQKITKGITTKEQVRVALGDASFVSLSESGKEQWMYSFTKARPNAASFVPYLNIIDSSATSNTKQLVILFDAKGVVSNYTFSDSVSQSGYGLAPGALSQ